MQRAKRRAWEDPDALRKHISQNTCQKGEGITSVSFPGEDQEYTSMLVSRRRTPHVLLSVALRIYLLRRFGLVTHVNPVQGLSQ